MIFLDNEQYSITLSVKPTIEIEEDKFILTSKLSKINHRGNPLDALTIDPTIHKYYTEMSNEEFKRLGQLFDIKCVEFIVANLLENKKTSKKINLG